MALVTKLYYCDIGKRYENYLTQQGQALHPVLLELTAWAIKINPEWVYKKFESQFQIAGMAYSLTDDTKGEYCVAPLWKPHR